MKPSIRFSRFVNISLCLETQAVKETGQRFRNTILALGGGKAPLQVNFLIAL